MELALPFYRAPCTRYGLVPEGFEHVDTIISYFKKSWFDMKVHMKGLIIDRSTFDV